MKWHLDDGTGLAIRQETHFPWSGEVKLTVTPAQAKEFTLYLRNPGWSAKTMVRVNGKAADSGQPGQYMALRRQWKAGDVVELGFDMTPQMIHANPAVREDVGKLAFQSGPVVFCMEELDQKVQTRQVNLGDYAAHPEGETSVRFDPTLLGGVMVLEHKGTLLPATEQQALYRASGQRPEQQSTTLTLIPYYAWANRQPSSMQVWVPYRET